MTGWHFFAHNGSFFVLAHFLLKDLQLILKNKHYG